MSVRTNGPEIIRRRMAKKLTRAELAERAEVHERTIGRLELGNMAQPSTIRYVAEVLGCRYEDLVAESAETVMASRAIVVAHKLRSGFVGRVSELATLERLWQRARLGKGNSVFVTGERGIGKTELIRQFMVNVQPKQTLGSWVNCPEGGGEFYPFHEMLEQLERQSNAATRSVMSSFWRGGDLTSARLARGAPSRAAIGFEMLKILTAYARELPVLLVFEDIHRANKQSLELLELIATHNPGSLLLVCEFRPLEAPGYLKEMIDNLSAKTETIALETFDREDVRESILAEFGASFEADPWFIDDILTWSGGTPLHIRLSLDRLRRHGAIEKTPQGFVLRWTRNQIRQFTPDKQVKAVEEILSSLQHEWREMLEVASVEGKRFHPSVVAQVLGRPAYEVERVMHTLERERGILRRLQDPSQSSRKIIQQYEFSHGIFRDVLQSQIPFEWRTTLSTKVADALVAILGASPIFSQLEMRAMFYVTGHLGTDEKWARINRAVWEVLKTRSDHTLRLSEIDSVAADTSSHPDEVLAVLALLSRPSSALLKMEYLATDSDGLKKEVSGSEAIAHLRAWWRDKSVTEEEWWRWAGAMVVCWNVRAMEDLQ